MDLALSLLPPVGDDVEVVEHKGIGHPDTMCDALAEALGVALARAYLERFGRLFHFNVDKALLVGGRATPAFGGGTVDTPVRMILAGRATERVGGVALPIAEIATETGKAWVREHLHALDPDRHVVWTSEVHGGSADLVELFDARGTSGWLANDTSFGAGYAPLSPLERTVLAAAERLRALARERPCVGEDVKVMGVRRGEELRLTVACAFVGAHLVSLDDYAAARADVAREVARAASAVLDASSEVDVVVNAADDLATGRVYLTVTGTSAESGDDGQVGRGNRVNGLITPYRPMSLEAAAGKNPVSHVGKLYNVLAHRVAAAIVADVPEIEEARCWLLSRIGRPVDDPMIADVRVRTRDGAPLERVRPRVEAIVRDRVGRVASLTDELLAGRVRLY